LILRKVPLWCRCGGKRLHEGIAANGEVVDEAIVEGAENIVFLDV